MSASRALPDLSALRLFAAPTGGGCDVSDSSDDDDTRKRQKVDPASYILATREYTFTFGKQFSASGVGIPDCPLTFRVYRCKRPWDLAAVNAMMPIATIDYRGYARDVKAYKNEDADWICIVLHERENPLSLLSTWAIAVELNGKFTCSEFLPAFSAKWRRGEICKGHKHIVAKYLVATDIILRTVLRGEPPTPRDAPLDDMLADIRDEFHESKNDTKKVYLAEDTAISDDMQSSFLLKAYAALMNKVVANGGKNLPEVVAGGAPIAADDISSYVAAAAVNVAIKLLWRAPYYKRLGASEESPLPEFTLEGAAKEYGIDLPRHPLVKMWIEKLEAQAEAHPDKWYAKQSDVDFLPHLPTPCAGWEDAINPHFSLVLVNPADAESTVTDRLVTDGLVTVPDIVSVRSL